MRGLLRARVAFLLAGSSLLGVGLATILGLRLGAAWYLPTHDHDTGSLINVLHGGFRHATTLTDIAHPGGLEVLMTGLGRLPTNACNARTVWFAAFSLVLILSATLLFFAARSLSGSLPGGLAVTTAYLASPVVADLASRGEENVAFHAPLILAVLCFHRVATGGTSLWRPALLGVVGLLLAALHLQPFAVIGAGALCASIGPGPLDRSARKRALMAWLAFSGSGLTYLLGLTLLTSLARPNYMTIYYSLLHNDSTPRYMQSFLLFAQGYLLTGRLPNSFTGSGYVPASGVWLLGVPTVVGVALIARRLRLVDWITLAGLGFVFAYEPSSSERWDTLLVPLLLALAASMGDENGTIRRSAWWMLMILLVGGSSALAGDLRSVAATQDRLAAMRAVIGDLPEIFVRPTPAIALATAAPHGIQLRNLDRTPRLPLGALTFLTSDDMADAVRKCPSFLRPLSLGFHRCEAEQP